MKFYKGNDQATLAFWRWWHGRKARSTGKTYQPNGSRERARRIRQMGRAVTRDGYAVTRHQLQQATGAEA